LSDLPTIETDNETPAELPMESGKKAPPAIEVRGLTKHYGALRALDEVSFTVARGEIVGFLGPNGAGKSTTMRILCGLASATSGQASVAGQCVARHPERVKRRIGYMPENNPLPEEMRVLEYLRLRARLKEVPMRQIRQRVDEAMETCDLQRKARRRVIGTLSKGYRQRVGIADAILSNPEVIIMDEPTIGLDPHQILSIRRLIDSLRGRMTVILSSHILPEIELVCDRVIIINQGHIVASGTSAELRREFIDHSNWRVTIEHDHVHTLEKALHEIDATSEIRGKLKQEDRRLRTLRIRAGLHTELGNALMRNLSVRAPEALREVAHLEPDLEDIFMAATRKSWQETATPFNLSARSKQRKEDPEDKEEADA